MKEKALDDALEHRLPGELLKLFGKIAAEPAARSRCGNDDEDAQARPP
jgi:hypothetical protein